MTEVLAVIAEEEQQYQPGTPSMSAANTCTDKPITTSQKHPQGFPKNIERMFETFHQTPSGEFKPTFYNPFEIKHRRRTSRDQFQVLESSFLDNSKPNATVRRALAQRLGMTPRAVQVWFQNRRAKLKTITSGNPNGSQGEMSEAPDSPQITSADASTQCSSLASPDHTAISKPTKMVKKGLGRRHSMPNMAQPAPIITNEHFKQLHEAIFGGHMLTPHLSQQNLNYQVPMKPLHASQSYDQGYAAPPSYYPPGYLPPAQHMHSPQVHKTRAPSMAYGNPMMGLENPNMDPTDSPMANDLDYFLQSIIIPQGAQQQQQQQQMFLSSLMQNDPAQISGMTENLASFLCASASNGHSEPVVTGAAAQQHNDSYLLSKYMNDERFAD